MTLLVADPPPLRTTLTPLAASTSSLAAVTLGFMPRLGAAARVGEGEGSAASRRLRAGDRDGR